MYPGKVSWTTGEPLDECWGKGEYIPPKKSETEKEKSNSINFDDPESPDYISGSPAFDVYYQDKRWEKEIREFNQTTEQPKKAGVFKTIVKNFHKDWPFVVPFIILPLIASIGGIFLWIFS